MARLVLLCFILLQISIFLATAREIKESPNALVTPTKIQIDVAESPNASTEEMETESPETAEGPVGGNREESKPPPHHHETGEFAGGGVILGGLATAFFAAVFCYIRVTRKQNTEEDIKITTMNHKPDSPPRVIPTP